MNMIVSAARCMIWKFFIFIMIVAAFGITTANAQQLIHDTLFLRREIRHVDSYIEHPEQRIDYSGRYIETNKSSTYYKRILDFDFKEITTLGKYNANGKIDTDALKELPHKWCPVFRYKVKFYMFSTHWFNKKLLTDTALLVSGMEGVYSEGYNSFGKIDDSTFQLNVNTRYGKSSGIIIHLIDTAKGLAVFEYFVPGKVNDKHNYALMVGGADKINAFPLMISFFKTRILPDTTWYSEKPGNFYIPPFDGKSFLKGK